MRMTQMLVRSGLTVAAAALPLTLTATEAVAVNTAINVTTSGTTVQVTTTDCATRSNGSMGNASLLSSGQANFAQGRQVTLSGTSTSQAAAWSSVTTGTYTVIVVCADGTTAGTQSVTVSPVSSPTISATATATATSSASPSRGVMGGMGGGTKDYGAATYAAGGVLVAAGVGATVWVLRRRAKPHRL
ncbi:hypothetical protein [Streptomyces phaeochromogenes]|uniref:hypothetical protein n=1 Tax=Streptomyces phaeochromogenes TaxID=1923 RepID=UPI0006E283D1|nr:hypothetical protein [Streptomyces phaeochromogenes]MCX5599218.1 hypothetical protein [Streptomyces phaeochromogenes]WRZ34407.1 hypothetical protein OG931_45075 [Streptomyces phaeochromogenes]WSS98351.1 hypothetical protein OG478_45055 [Streptomyces phaeochromogenes]WSW12571.1 hypothetical protein OG277_05870 [Streptomyces phaeochromogenes]WTA08876.1 hypothetical protein OHB08_44825 [Streptomyces phaeochromogenes]